MKAFVRRHGLQALIFVAQVALLSLAAHAQSGTAAWLAVLLLAVLSLAGWLQALSVLRRISDTPLSRIASAAQGYVALQGRGKALAGLPLLSPYNGLPVLWYRLKIEERNSDNDWQDYSEDTSDACLLLDDGSGHCVIDPAGAQVHCARREHQTRDRLRYTHWCILEHEQLFVLGDFRTRSDEHLAQTEREAVKQILADWKQDPAELRRRFDLDRNGEISPDEWELARAQAQREARQARIEADQAASLHLLACPADGRPFILSAVSSGRLKLPQRGWCALHVALFLSCCLGCAQLLQHGTLAF